MTTLKTIHVHTIKLIKTLQSITYIVIILKFENLEQNDIDIITILLPAGNNT